MNTLSVQGAKRLCHVILPILHRPKRVKELSH